MCIYIYKYFNTQYQYPFASSTSERHSKKDQRPEHLWPHMPSPGGQAHLIQHGRGMYFDCYLRSAFAAAKHGARTGLEMDRNTIPNLSVAWAQSYLRSTNNRHSNVSSVKNMILKTSSADDCKQCITMSHKHVMLRRLELQKMVWRTNWCFSIWRRFVGSKFQPFILWRGSNPSRLSTVSGMVLRLCSVFFGVFDVSSGVS